MLATRGAGACSCSSSATNGRLHVGGLHRYARSVAHGAASRRQRQCSAAAAGMDTRDAGPPMPAPSYAGIDAQPLNRVVMQLFRSKLAGAVGADSQQLG